MILFFLSFFSTFLKSDHGERDFINFAKLWIFLLFTVWVTSSLAGVAAGVASALLALTLASFVGSAVFISASVSYSDQKGYLFGLWNRIIEKYSGWLDIARGLAVAILLPLWFVYLVLSFLNQRVRRLGLKCSKKIKSEEEKADFYTRATRRQIKDVRTWDLSTIFVYAVYWGAGFVIMNVVVAKLTVLFLSWLIEKTGPLGLGATTGIMILVGIIMFLLPPVPGPPIYVSLNQDNVPMSFESTLTLLYYTSCEFSLQQELFSLRLEDRYLESPGPLSMVVSYHLFSNYWPAQCSKRRLERECQNLLRFERLSASIQIL
jgi:hypothetical protein